MHADSINWLGNRWWLECVVFATIVLLGFAVRLYAIRTIPPGLYSDEAAYAVDARAVIHGVRAIFFENNSGREPLFIYLLAVAFALVGDNAHTVRFTAAVIGALTVPATYFMARAASRFSIGHASGSHAASMRRVAPWLAPWVSLLLALSYWHLSFSRLGFRAITLPLVLAVASTFLFRVLYRISAEGGVPWSDLLLTGFFTGLTLYTYTAGRIAPVFMIVAMGTALVLGPRLGMDSVKLRRAVAVIVSAMLITMIPLLIYFVLHPFFFAGHALGVSVLNEKFGGGHPYSAMLQNVHKFVAMFFTLHDQNIRHDPALRPVIDWLLGGWLLLGIILGLLKWKRFTLFYFVLWTCLFAAPSMLSAQGAPQSLRAIGMMPALFVLPVAAMLWAGMKVAPGHPKLALLAPLPFVLLSGILGVRDYFRAFDNAGLFRIPFLVDYVELGEAIRANQDDARWIIPLSASYSEMENRIETINYVVNDPTRFRSIWLDPAEVSAALQSFTAGAHQVNVLELYDQLQFGSNAAFLDSKQILGFLLARDSAAPQSLQEGEAAIATHNGGGLLDDSIPYKTYLLDDSPDFSLPSTLRSADVRFADYVQLDGLSTGSAGRTADSAEVQLRSGERLWAVLEWAALQAIDFDLKTSLVLLDAEGLVVAQKDGMLTGDSYPVERTWQSGDPTRTYHLLEARPGTPPGRYTLALSVYEDKSGRVYPASVAGAEAAQRAILGQVELLPSLRAPLIAPQFPLTDMLLGQEIGLAGYDLPRTAVAPGETLGFTLYWQAEVTPTRALSAVMELVDGAGAVVASEAGAPGGSGYPTTAWTPGFAVREMRDLPIAATAPSGTYALRVRLFDGENALGEASLGEITVDGRPRHMEQPHVEQPLAASFGDSVRLVGVSGLPTALLAPGDTLALTFVWQPQRTIDAPLVRSVQILDAAGALVAQQDGIPCAESCPATSWLPGEYLLDATTLTLPADLPPGVYRVIVGWYNPETLERLTAVDSDGASLPDNMALVHELVAE